MSPVSVEINTEQGDIGPLVSQEDYSPDRWNKLKLSLPPKVNFLHLE